MAMTLLNLGPHRLKDFERTEHLYQVGHAPFPPIRSLGGTTLPNPFTSFVGRKRSCMKRWALFSPTRCVHGSRPRWCGEDRFSIQLARLLQEDQPAGRSSSNWRH